MKKLSIILISILLVFTLTFSAFAETPEGFVEINGHTIPDSILQNGNRINIANLGGDNAVLFIYKMTNPTGYLLCRIVNANVTAYEYQSYYELKIDNDSSVSFYNYDPDLGNDYFTFLSESNYKKGDIIRTNLSIVYMPFVWSNRDLVATNTSNTIIGGTAFPSPPLWEIVQGVTGEELTEATLPKMVGTMKILVACGVGLMACLVLLKLFGKRSLIYRN